MQVRKSKQEWRRRWVVLEGNYLICYSSKQNLVMKNKMLLTKNMNVEVYIVFAYLITIFLTFEQ